MKFLILFTFFWFGLSHARDKYDHPYMKVSDVLDGIIVRTVCEEKGYKLDAIGGGAVYALTLFLFGFKVDEVVDVKRAREIYLDTIHRVIEIANAYKPARPYFVQFPLGNENFRITMSFKEDKRYKDAVLFMYLVNGSVFYNKRSESNPEGYQGIHKETYEEALEALAQSM